MTLMDIYLIVIPMMIWLVGFGAAYEYLAITDDDPELWTMWAVSAMWPVIAPAIIVCLIVGGLFSLGQVGVRRLLGRTRGT